MVNLNIRRQKSGVPVLSRDQIDDLGERLVYDFCPQAMTTPQELDVDLFAQAYLGMEQDYQYLSHCGVYLGMTVFNDTDRVVVYNPDKDEADYISVKARTIIIDSSLLSEKQEHRYRFTMGHEAAGHGVLHEEYFGYNSNQISMFDTTEVAMIQCRTDGARKGAAKKRAYWDDRDWMEWQANAMSSAFLMPKAMVRLVAREIEMTYGSANKFQLAYLVADAVSEIFNVSQEAAFYRLQKLGMIPTSLPYGDSSHNFLASLI
jgi:hypothetical protein